MLIRARAPLRLGIAGGGTDVAPYPERYGGSVLNATIDKYAYAVIKMRQDQQVIFNATDAAVAAAYEYAAFKDQLAPPQALALHKEVYCEIMQQYNGGRYLPLELYTFCDAPLGSGLGSSSALVVAMLKAFVELLQLPLDDYALAALAFKIERLNCALAGGQQDQYAATFGGLNFMEFYADNRVVVHPLKVKNWITCELESSLVLFYTGISRGSAEIITQQTQQLEAHSCATLEAMHALKQESLLMKECLLRGDFRGMVDCLQHGWKNKKLLTKNITNAYIDELYETILKAGALAGKISGAEGDLCCFLCLRISA